MPRRVPTFALALTLALAAALPARAQTPGLPAPTPPPAETAAAPAPEVTPRTVPAPALDTVAEPRPASAESERVAVPEPSEKAVRYHSGGNVLWVIGTLWGLLLPAVILFTGLSAKIRDVAKRMGRGWFFTLALYAALYTLLAWAVSLPLAYYSEFARQHAYGLSNQSLGAWAGDTAKALLLGILGLALVLWIPYLLLKRSPRRWWLYSSLAAVPIIVFFVWLSPVLIAPMFDRFGPMRNAALEAKILALADRAGIEGGRVFEVAKSEDTNAVNAYVTGIGASKRIVLWDTLLEKLDEREVLFVMGHEMGHYVLRHVVWTVLILIVGVFVSLWVVHRTAGWLIGRFRHRFGFDSLADPASYPLLLLVTGVVGLLATPALNAYSRHNEHEADRFGLELVRDNRAAASAFAKLQAENLGVPYPGALYVLFRASHPPLGERIEFANEYRPWERGESLRYGELVEPSGGGALR